MLKDCRHNQLAVDGWRNVPQLDLAEGDLLGLFINKQVNDDALHRS